MSDEQQETQTVTVIEKESSAPVLGILSTVFGATSLIPLLGIISPLALILGVIGLKVDKKKTLSIVGTSLAVVGMITSPILWCLTVVDCDEKAEEMQKTVDDAKQKQQMPLPSQGSSL